MAKRPQFSRWRRLPSVYRFGDDKPPDPNLEPQRLSLYVAIGAIDLAEAQARRLGFANVQDYCTELLLQAIEAERVREHVDEVEARHGGFEGLHEISDDPTYLAEIRTVKGPRGPVGASAPSPPIDPLSVPIHFLSAESDDPPLSPEVEEPAPRQEFPPIVDVEYSSAGPASEGRALIGPSDRPKGDLSHAALTVLRHAGQLDDDPSGFLPSLRRGANVSAADVGDLAQALNDLEREYRTRPFMDRRLSFALHRLAYESQILHTDAWPGVYDVWTVDTVRAVQEAVERILSGQDIRYYPQQDTNPDPRPESYP